MAQLKDLDKLLVNTSQLHIETAAVQQAKAVRKKLRKSNQAVEIALTLVNNDNKVRVFSIFAALHLSRTATRYNTPAGAAVVTGFVTDGAGGALVDITCDLPAGIDALRHKLIVEKAVIAGIGLQVSADANVDNFQLPMYFSKVDGQEQLDEKVKDIKTRVNSNLQERTQLIWPKSFQVNDDHDALFSVKAETEMTVILKISEYGFTFFTPAQ